MSEFHENCVETLDGQVIVMDCIDAVQSDWHKAEKLAADRGVGAYTLCGEGGGEDECLVRRLSIVNSLYYMVPREDITHLEKDGYIDCKGDDIPRCSRCDTIIDDDLPKCYNCGKKKPKAKK